MEKIKIYGYNAFNMSDRTEQMRKIKDEIVAAKDSPLYEYRIKNKYFPVIGEGSHSAKIMFIGEAPGKNEAETGRPFCGAAGHILDELLESASLDRKEVYITNVVKDRPPENRDPNPNEIEFYDGDKFGIGCQAGSIKIDDNGDSSVLVKCNEKR